MKKISQLSSFSKGKLKIEVDTPEYYFLKTHPSNKDRVDSIVEWNCAGFIGFKPKK